MRSEPAQVGDLLVGAIVEGVLAGLDERIGVILQRSAQPVERTAYSLDETAESWNVSRSTVKRLVDLGLVETITIGQRRLVPMTEVHRIASHGAATHEAAS